MQPVFAQLQIGDPLYNHFDEQQLENVKVNVC
jgi:hypothetical protein